MIKRHVGRQIRFVEDPGLCGIVGANGVALGAPEKDDTDCVVAGVSMRIRVYVKELGQIDGQPCLLTSFANCCLFCALAQLDEPTRDRPAWGSKLASN